MRVCLRVTDTAAPPGVGRSLLRLIGLWFAIAPLFAGFLPYWSTIAVAHFRLRRRHLVRSEDTLSH